MHRRSRTFAVSALAFASLVPVAQPAAAAPPTFFGTCTAHGVATFTGPITAATYVVVDTTKGHCTGRLGHARIVRAPIALHAEATTELNGVRAHGFADITFVDQDLVFHLALTHYTPAHGVDTDGRGGYIVTNESPREAPRCDGKLPWETIPPVLPNECTGTATIEVDIVARTLTPIHSG